MVREYDGSLPNILHPWRTCNSGSSPSRWPHNFGLPKVEFSCFLAFDAVESVWTSVESFPPPQCHSHRSENQNPITTGAMPLMQRSPQDGRSSVFLHNECDVRALQTATLDVVSGEFTRAQQLISTCDQKCFVPLFYEFMCSDLLWKPQTIWTWGFSCTSARMSIAPSMILRLHTWATQRVSQNNLTSKRHSFWEEQTKNVVWQIRN